MSTPLAFAGCAHPRPGAPLPAPGTQAPQALERRVEQVVRVNYLLHLPRGYAVGSGQRWPLILFLHGAGERGTHLGRVKAHGPPKLVEQQPDFPFIVVSPQCPEGEWWQRDSLLALLDEVSARLAVDTNRIYLTGLSMGGYASWMLGTAHPERFAAIAPICGGGETIGVLIAGGRRLESLKSMGVWAFHGAKDSVVRLEESERMIDSLRRKGCTDVRLTVYPNAEHDSWTETYQNPELYQWFLQHDRSRRPVQRRRAPRRGRRPTA